MLTIEIFSDVICPWCYIGKRRLDQVLDSDTGEGVSVRWRPFQLYPNVPVEVVIGLSLYDDVTGQKLILAVCPDVLMKRHGKKA